MKPLYVKQDEVGISYDSHLILIFKRVDKKVVHVTTMSTLERLPNGTRDLWVPKAAFKRAIRMAYDILMPSKKKKEIKGQLRLF